MLVNHQVKTRLLPMPLDRFQHGRTHATAPDNFDPLEHLFPCRARKIIRKPKHFVAAFGQCGEISQRHTLGSASQRVLRVAPVQHQESHESGKGYSREIFSSNAVVDLPGTSGRITILPPADSTVRRSSWFNVSRV